MDVFLSEFNSLLHNERDEGEASMIYSLEEEPLQSGHCTEPEEIVLIREVSLVEEYIHKQNGEEGSVPFRELSVSRLESCPCP